jgi:trk system potassium uptake protein TrkA
MRVIICGAGRVGFGIARELASERNAVTVVDLSPQLVQQVASTLDVRGVVGHGAYPDVLEQAGARDAELLIAATFSDEVNMIACQVAHSLFDVPTNIARVRAQSYLNPAWQELFSSGCLPIDLAISPEVEVGKAILRRLEAPGAFESIPFADGRVRVLGIRLAPDCPIIDTPLSQLTELFPTLKARVIGVKRDERLFAPKGGDQLSVNDEVYLAVEADQANRALEIFGRQEPRARRVVLVGGGNVAVYVAQALEASPGVRVRMIETNKEKAERAAEGLKKTVVLHGDGLSPEVLREAGVEDAEVIVSLTNDDKVNVLSASLAKAEGAGRAICLVNERAYTVLKSALSVDVFVDPRAATVSTILRHVRKGRILALHSLEEGEAELIEGVVLETSPLAGKTIARSDLGDGVIIGAVLRSDEVIMPRGDFRFQVGDRLVLFAERAQVGEVERAFRVAFEYF